MKKIWTIFLWLAIMNITWGEMEIPRGAYWYKDLKKAKAEAIKEEKVICFFVT